MPGCGGAGGVGCVVGVGVVCAGGGVVVGAQAVVTLSLVDSSGNAVTSVGEDIGSRGVRLKATVTSAPSANLRVTLGASFSGTAAEGRARNLNLGLPGASERWVCEVISNNNADFCVRGDPWQVTIPAGQTSFTSTGFTVMLRSDRITENHETITFSGTASGYTVNGATLTINDQDRAVKVNVASNSLVLWEGREGESLHNNKIRQYRYPTPSAVLGGVSGGVFTASTSSTYSSSLAGMRIQIESGTATQTEWDQSGGNDVYHLHHSDSNDPMQATINAGSISGNFVGILWQCRFEYFWNCEG